MLPTENYYSAFFNKLGSLISLDFGAFYLILKCSCILNNFRNYSRAKALETPHMILFNNFWLCLLKLLVKVIAMSVTFLLRFLRYFLIISFFLICVFYVLSVLHASYLYVCFVNISAYILTDVPIKLSNLIYTTFILIVLFLFLLMLTLMMNMLFIAI